MNKRYFKRIVTFMAYPLLCESPKVLLYLGSRTITQSRKRRWFVIRKVYYDETMTPIYSTPDFTETRYKSLQELRKNNPDISILLFDAPVLDGDHSLKVWER